MIATLQVSGYCTGALRSNGALQSNAGIARSTDSVCSTVVSLCRPTVGAQLLGEVLRRAEMYASHQIQMESLSTRERMSQVLETLTEGGFVPFVSLFKPEEGRLGVVVTFLALMELMKESLIELVQTEGFGPIHIKAKSE